MALRDRQISGIPLTETQSEVISHIMTALTPVFGYTFWYPMFGIPEEFWIFLAIIGVTIHVAQSVEIVPNGVVRNLLWFGAYTGASFSNGIRFIARLPFPLVLLFIRLAFGAEVYMKIFWSLKGDVSIQSIIVRFVAEGLARCGSRVRITGMLRLEVEHAAVFHSQTLNGRQDILDMMVGEYQDSVKSSVIMQHTAEELMRGTHSGNTQEMTEWMTNAWNSVKVFGVSLARAPIATVEILSTQVERAFDRIHAKEIFIGGAESLADIYAAFKEKLPAGTSEEVAFSLFNADRIDNGEQPIDINVVKFK